MLEFGDIDGDPFLGVLVEIDLLVDLPIFAVDGIKRIAEDETSRDAVTAVGNDGGGEKTFNGGGSDDRADRPEDRLRLSRRERLGAV